MTEANGRVERLHLAYATRLEAFARGLLRDAEAAGDVVQTAFLKCLEHDPDDRNELAWLYQVVRNDCLTRLKRAKTHHRIHQTLPQPTTCNAVDSVEEDEWAAAIHGVLSRLSDEERALVKARFFEGASYDELSRRFATNASTLTTRLHRILKRIRSSLPPDFDPTTD